jgi:hypothetical protein
MGRPRAPHVVVAAWIVTGPIGHFYAGVVDWVVAIVRWRLGRRV